MSDLIDQASQRQPHKQDPSHFKNSLKRFLSQNQFCTRGLQDRGKSLSFWLDSSPKNTLPVVSEWNVRLSQTNIQITVLLYHPETMVPMYIASERLKVQFISFIRRISLQEIPDFFLGMEPRTGLISGVCLVSYRQDFTKAINLPKMLISKMLKNIRSHLSEIMFFTYLSNSPKPAKQQQDKNHLQKLYRFRYLLLQTRYSAKKIMNEVTEADEQNTGSPRDNQIQKKSLHLYFQCLEQLSQIHFGVEESTNKILNIQKEFCHELARIREYSQWKQTNPKDRIHSSKSKTIVCGIDIAQRLGKEQIISKEGAHSQIFQRYFKFAKASTINWEVEKQLNNGRTRKYTTSLLAFKKCVDKETSKNSFMNELQVLQYIRNLEFPYLPEYFLDISQRSRNIDEPIYMIRYEKNLAQLIKEATSMTRSQQIILAFRICKGLCFFAWNNILHRDIKPGNIVVDKENCPKIIDLGCACPEFGSTHFIVHDSRLLGTQPFHIPYKKLSPQVKTRYTEAKYEQHSLFDIYGLGKTLCSIFFNNRLELPIDEQANSFGTDPVMGNIMFLIKMAIQPDPDDRPGIGQITAFLGALHKIRSP